MGGIDPLVAAFACESSLSTAILTHGLLLFGRVPIHQRWYKALKSRVVQVKYEKKGLHTYNGKLTEEGGNFVCISTVLHICRPLLPMGLDWSILSWIQSYT